jgi:hypothetical protein
MCEESKSADGTFWSSHRDQHIFWVSVSLSQRCLILTYQAMCQVSLTTGSQTMDCSGKEMISQSFINSLVWFITQNNEVFIGQILFQLTGLK